MQGEITRSAALVLFPPTARAYGPITASRRTRTEILRAALRWCSSRPRLARMGPLRHHGAPAQQHRAEPVRHSVPLCCCSRKPHRLTRESCRSCVRTYLTYISETVQEQREAGPQHACISLRDRSQQRWLAFSGYFVARRVCECDSVWGAGAAWRGSFWPTFRAIPPPSRPFAALSLIRRPPRPRPGRIHVRAPPPARGAGAQLPALGLLYYRVSCGGVCVVQCVG